jgi:thioredoxin reductase
MPDDKMAQLAINTIRTLSIDAVQAARSGHPGTPMVVRGDSLSATMSQYLEDQIKVTKNILISLNSQVIEVRGTERCEELVIENKKTGEKQTTPASALLIYAGAVPRTE